MSKIILIGGSSEIGNAVSKEIKRRNPEKYQEILRLSSSLSAKDAIGWNPSTLEGIKLGLNQIDMARGDLAIIALGSLGQLGNSENENSNVDNLAEIYNVNLVAPALSMGYLVSRLDSLGGGTIVVLSSTAAFPVLDNNFLYGSAKRGLDNYARYLQRSRKGKNTQICIVRSGFVQTKLNKNRTPTPFSQTAEEVAQTVARHVNKNIIWTPSKFKYISFALRKFALLRFLASKIVEKSMK